MTKVIACTLKLIILIIKRYLKGLLEIREFFFLVVLKHAATECDTDLIEVSIEGEI